MISEARYGEAFAWCWLPGASEPVVAGRLAREGERLVFNYGRSYLEREDAVSLYEPELPLRRGVIEPLPGLRMAGCLRDASPDAWGRRVILRRRLQNRGAGSDSALLDTGELDELAYLLESGSDRVGALDFQRSATEYVPRGERPASLEALADAAARVEQGLPLNPELDAALQHGTSIGGARPKALIEAADRKYVAKFASTTDLYNLVKAEFLAMRLAALAGLDVAPVRLVRALGKDVLLVERFDRVHSDGGWQRRAVVSALTLLGLDEMMARYASYPDLAELIRHRFTASTATLRELYSRLVFNVLCGNTDDHARNHAAFWNGRELELTPAYDICPQPRTGNEASQAMLITGEDRMSRIQTCLAAAPDFLLSQDEALEIAAQLAASIETHWEAACDEAGLEVAERRALRGRQFLNPYAVAGLPGAQRFAQFTRSRG